MNILNRLKVKAKLAIVLGISALSLIATIVLGASFLHHKIVADREEQAKRLVEVARSIVESWHEKEKSGALTEHEAQHGALAALRPLRYGNNEYFFIQGYNGVSVLNPNRPELEGKPRWDARDPDGVPNVRLQIEAARSGGGFVYYRFPRVGVAAAVPKVSYTAGFDPWRWAICTGIYIDDLDEEFRMVVARLVLIASAMFGVAALCAYSVSRNVGASLNRLKAKMEKLAAGDLSVEVGEAARRDEIGDMGKAMLVFKENAVAAQQLRVEQQKRQELELAVSHSARVDALGRLAGGIAHDLNNSLVPVLALTKTAMSRLPAGSRERSSLELVLMGAERAKDLVQQILAFSRKQEIEKRDFDLAQVVKDGIRMLRASVPSTIKLVSLIDPVPAVHGDPGQLHQVLVNLVTNAAQAIGEVPGTITISLRVEDEAWIRLLVSDTGCGMDEQTRARIFEPFFTTKEVGKGTGLGLSVVHGIVTFHGGTITVQSKTGQGTRIDVVLRVAQHKKAMVHRVKAAE